VGFACGKGFAALGVASTWNIAAAAVAFAAMLWALLKFTESRSYLLYLVADMIWTWQFAHRLEPEWDQRIDRFAKNLVEVASGSDAEEVVIVGHSSGSFLAVEILARALQLDPDIGRHGPRIALLTIGGNLPIIGFNAAAQDFRDHLRRLAVEPSIDWIDCQARKDVMNFYPFDPIIGHGIDVGAARRNPLLVSVRFRDIIEPAHYNSFRWQFFRVHFQFVMANERPHPYDFFMIACGPVPLRERMARPEAAVAIATGDAAARETGWKILQTIIPDQG
jgi:pimeloyl-ACP methyl ester carboxylesterase